MAGEAVGEVTGRARQPATTFRPPASEKEWQRQVEDVLIHAGWDYLHVFPLRTQHGWRTPTSGTLAKGWPDLIAFRDGIVLFIEAKRDGRYPEPEQYEVLVTLANERLGPVWVVRPKDDVQQLYDWLAHPGTMPRFHGWDPVGRVGFAG